MTKKNGTAEQVKIAKCPISRADFAKHAKPMLVDIDGTKFVMAPRDFSTGSVGWRCGEKMVISVNGVPCKVQINCNLMVIGSKEEK